MKDVFEAALRATEAGEKAALVTVISTEGSTPQKAGPLKCHYRWAGVNLWKTGEVP